MKFRRWFHSNRSRNRTFFRNRFECLPNELIYLIFDYFSCDEIVYSFSNLNSHFQTLLQTYPSYHMNLCERMLKFNFNSIYQMSIDGQQIKSLVISYGDIDWFFFHYPIEIFYFNLQYLHLNEIDQYYLTYFTNQFPNFRRLTHFKVSLTSLESDSYILSHRNRDIILFEAKSLKSFIWNINISFFNHNYNQITRNKSNIEYFEFYSLQIDELEWLNVHTANLKSISVYQSNIFCSFHQNTTFENLISLEFLTIDSKSEILCICQHLKDLIQLKRLTLWGDISKEDDCLDGYEWKDLLDKYLPQLKILRFFFTLTEWFKLITKYQLIESFQNHFWLVEKQWFITCAYQARRNETYFYTDPYFRNQLAYEYPCQHISTNLTSFKNSIVTDFCLDNIAPVDLIFSHRFVNIQLLILGSIDDGVTYGQLNQLLNLSAIKYIDFRRKIHRSLIFNIFRFHQGNLSIKIMSDNLKELIRTNDISLQKIKSLQLNGQPLSTKQELRQFCSSFSKLEQLIFQLSLTSSQLVYLLNKLKHLSILELKYYKSNYKIEQLLSKHLKKENFFFKLSDDYRLSIYLNRAISF